jgi:hypothetical protein
MLGWLAHSCLPAVTVDYNKKKQINIEDGPYLCMAVADDDEAF